MILSKRLLSIPYGREDTWDKNIYADQRVMGKAYEILMQPVVRLSLYQNSLIKTGYNVLALTHDITNECTGCYYIWFLSLNFIDEYENI